MLQIEPVQHVVEVAKGVYDYGFGSVSAAAFVITGIITVVSCWGVFMWTFKKLFNNQQKTLQDQQRMFEKHEKMLGEIANVLVGIDAKINQLHNDVESESLSQIKVTMRNILRANKHDVCAYIIATIKERADNGSGMAVEKEVRVMLNNLYNTVKTDMDVFRYNGKDGSEYCLDEWVDRVYNYCIEAINDGKQYHREPYLRGLGIIFKEIEREFIMNLRKK